MASNTIAYGFVGMEQMMAQRLTEVGTERVWDAVKDSADEWSRAANAMMSSIVAQTVNFKERYYLPGSGTLQPLDAYGNPLPVQPGSYFDVSYPIQGGGTAWGTNRVSRAMMTVEEANRNTLDALTRDADWMRRHVLAALLDNTTWVFDDPKEGDLTIQPLANGDAVVYLRTGGESAVDTHHLAQAAAIDDANNPFGTIYDELMEHPSNSGPVVVYTATDQVSAIEGLTAFIDVGDPDIIKGTASDRIGSIIDRGLGDEVLGKVDKCWIVEWRAMPDGYMIAHAQGAGPALKMREYAASELQGFFPEQHSPDGNLQEMRMLRYAGLGVANRIAAAVQYIGGGAYVIPTGYTNPLPV